MVYCPKCGRKNPDDAVVCAYCGANIAEEKERNEKQNQIKKREDFLRIIGLILLFVIVVVVIGLVFHLIRGKYDRWRK